MEHTRKCGNCTHFEACDNIIKRYAGFSGIEREVQACGYYAHRLEDILGNDYDTDRLQELIRADREDRIRILPESHGKTCGTCGHFKRIPGTCRGKCDVKPYATNRYGFTWEFEPSQSRKACKQYKSREE